MKQTPVMIDLIFAGGSPRGESVVRWWIEWNS